MIASGMIGFGYAMVMVVKSLVGDRSALRTWLLMLVAAIFLVMIGGMLAVAAAPPAG